MNSTVINNSSSNEQSKIAINARSLLLQAMIVAAEKELLENHYLSVSDQNKVIAAPFYTMDDMSDFEVNEWTESLKNGYLAVQYDDNDGPYTMVIKGN